MKFKLDIVETIRFTHTIIVEANTEEEVDSLCEEVDNIGTAGCLDDYCYELEKLGIKVLEQCEDEFGDIDEIECDYINKCEDEEDE